MHRTADGVLNEILAALEHIRRGSMTRARPPIRDDLSKKFVWFSMSSVRSNPDLLPLILRLDMRRLIHSDSVPAESAFPSATCRFCGAFFNPFCEVSPLSPNYRCSICNLVSELPKPTPDPLSSCACQNTVFDVVRPCGDAPTPRIVIAIESRLVSAVRSRLIGTLSGSSGIGYCLVLFDSCLQIFDPTRREWKVGCDVVVPAPMSRFFGSSEAVSVGLQSPASPVSDRCDVGPVVRFVSETKGAKLFIIVSGPLSEPVPELKCPCAVVVINELCATVAQMDASLGRATTNLIRVGSDGDVLNFFFWENLRLPFFNEADV
jgi:hypothetical protein